MKKILSVMLVFCMLFLMAMAAAFFAFDALLDDRADKEDVIAFVRENEEALLEAIEQGELSDYEKKGVVRKINAEEAVVDFFCGGAGVGSGTSYVGFYYTPDDDMVAVWCAPVSADSLTASGDGFAWQESEGDNFYYTEHICGHFYYYEASF